MFAFQQPEWLRPDCSFSASLAASSWGLPRYGVEVPRGTSSSTVTCAPGAGAGSLCNTRPSS